MTGAELREKMQQGQAVFGTALFMARNPRWARLFAGLDLDFVMVDREHAAFTRSEVADMVVAISGAGITPIVRVPFPSAREVTRMFDTGAQGILVPYCETIEEIRSVLAAARWRPLKGALLERAKTDGEFPSDAAQEYLVQNNHNNLMMIGIESVPTVENLENILQLDGIDVIFIGPLDLTLSLGIPGEIEHPDYEAVVQHVIETCTAHNVPVAIHLHSVEHAIKWVSAGVRCVIYRSDTRAMAQIFRQDLAAISQHLQNQ